MATPLTALSAGQSVDMSANSETWADIPPPQSVTLSLHWLSRKLLLISHAAKMTWAQTRWAIYSALLANDPGLCETNNCATTKWSRCQEGVLCGMQTAKCGNLKSVFCGISNAECSANYTLVFSAFCKIQIESNNQLRVDLSLYLSLESTSAHHKRCGHAVSK